MRHVRRSLLLLTGLGAAAIGCNDTGPALCGSDCKTIEAESFENDLPPGSQGSDLAGSRGSAELGGVASSAPPPTVPGQAASANDSGSKGDGASTVERTISEADIIQVQGDKLYALSRVAGLAVIDISNPDALRLLGRYRDLPATPFELYLRDGVALVMFSGWGQYVKVADGYSWISTSKLLALDVADPGKISEVGSFDVPGTISDSRVVGDVLYIAGYENGYCWGCGEGKPRTTITSLAVGDPRHVAKIDELFYTDDNSQYSGGAKSITVTDKRIYVSGPEYGEQVTGSTIQVVDISDPAGDLVEGARVKVAGQVQSRWQMDEYANTLRVISQPSEWWSARGTPDIVAPVIETFAVESSTKLTALGRAEIKLPMRESLRSARFDGTRAYAITAQQTDPLFTIDLSDPTLPHVVGELMMPGFVWHMEPRGERLLGVGYEQGNKDGSLAVSLFDVKDLANPVQLSRVHFGGTWANLPEDQDRAHKVFRIFDDAGLILVPFSGWSDLSWTCNGGTYTGGVEVIDFKDDTLKARGAAKTVGEARRAFLQNDRLLAVGDERVQTFDITNRDAPAQKSEIVLARQVDKAFQLESDAIARFSYDGASGSSRLDFVGKDAAGDPNESLSELDLATLTGNDGVSACDAKFSIDQVYVRGSELDILYNGYVFESNNSGSQRGLVVVDASDPSAPKVLSRTPFANDDGWSAYYTYYNYGYYNTGAATVRTAHTLSMLESKWTSTPVSTMQNVRLRVIDLRDPASVKTSILPFKDIALYSGLLVDGDTLLTSHMVVNETDSTRGRFYVDRFDLTDPSAPTRLPSVNVPGALVHYDASTQHAITSEQKLVEAPDLTAQQCYERFAIAEWANPQNGSSVGVSSPPRASSGTGGASASDGKAIEPAAPVVQPPEPTALCKGYQQHLHLVKLGSTGASLEDTLRLDEDQQVSGSSIGDGVVFANVGRGSYYGPYYGRIIGAPTLGTAAIDCAGPCGGYQPTVAEPSQLLVLGGFASEKFAVGRIDVEHAQDANAWWGFWGTNTVYASGKRAILVGQYDAAIIDASTPSAPTLVKQVDLFSHPSWTDVKDGVALFALGAQGLQWVPLQ